VSATFHGRDVFAPTAARLAAGEAPEAFCTPASDVIRLEWPRPRREGDVIQGEVIYVDHFGNAITNLSPDDLGSPAAGSLVFSIAGRRLPGPSAFYGSVPTGEAVVVLGSAGLYEVAIHQGDAATDLGLRVGTLVEARRRT
jgi:S-adenosylmethionine hydrolase